MRTELHSTGETASARRLDGKVRDSALGLVDDHAHLPALALVEPAGGLDWLVRLLPVAFIGVVLLVAFMPWQQSVSGSGRVIAYDPLDRRINLEARVQGVVRKSNLAEGRSVKAGEVLLELEDNDPNLLENLTRQRDEAMRRRDSITNRIREISLQIERQEMSMTEAVEAAQQQVSAARSAVRTASQNFDRIRELYEDKQGLASQDQFQQAELRRDLAQAELKRAEANVRFQEATLSGTIANTRSLRESALADLAAAELAIAQLNVSINQASRLVVEAPRDGIVLSVQATPGTFLRQGSPICVIIPETESRMIEIWLDGNDMPLATARQVDDKGNVVKPGSDVRVQFEGWPAVAFVGPFRAPRGTYGGEVMIVDPTDNGKGRFRVVVAPKPDLVRQDGREVSENWPDRATLRQGVRAQGWVLARQVPFWYEVWRQINGFPALPESTDSKFKAGFSR